MGNLVEFGKTKETTMSSKQKARCIARSIVGLPAKALGSDEYDPCAEFLGNKPKEPSEPVDTELDKDGKDIDNGNTERKSQDFNFNDNKSLPNGEEEEPSLLGSGVKMIEGVMESKKIQEEITRIKELLK